MKIRVLYDEFLDQFLKLEHDKINIFFDSLESLQRCPQYVKAKKKGADIKFSTTNPKIDLKKYLKQDVKW